MVKIYSVKHVSCYGTSNYFGIQASCTIYRVLKVQSATTSSTHVWKYTYYTYRLATTTWGIVETNVRPGLQYDAGAMIVTSVMRITEKYLPGMFLVKMPYIMYKKLTT